ncbi:TPA: hypothetical protein ACOFD8_002524 [Stenotrophomonas maltophilia]
MAASVGVPNPEMQKGQVGDLAFDAVVPVKGTTPHFPLNPGKTRTEAISNGFSGLRVLSGLL